MKEYSVTGVFSYTQLAENPGEISAALKRILLREGIEDKNFEITVEKVTPHGSEAVISDEERELLEGAGEIVIKTKKIKEPKPLQNVDDFLSEEPIKKRRGRPPKDVTKQKIEKKPKTTRKTTKTTKVKRKRG